MESYLSVDDADDLVEAMIVNTVSWDAATDPLKLKLLTISTNKIDRLNFVGERVSTSQALQFPRGTDTEVPDAIKEACLFLALRLLDEVDPELEVENQFMTQFQYSDIRSSYNRTGVAIHIMHGIPSIEAWNRIRPFLRESNAVKITRVT